MTKLAILEYPDPRLRTKAQPIERVDDGVRRLADDMLETMYAAKGVGLAASQVDVHRRLLVLDVSDARDQPLVFINPEIVSAEGDLFSGPAAAVFASASQGDLGIYPRHAPLLTLLKAGEVRVQTPDGEDHHFFVGGGALEVQPNKVTVLADTALRAKDLDEAAALAAKQRAQPSSARIRRIRSPDICARCIASTKASRAASRWPWSRRTWPSVVSDLTIPCWSSTGRRKVSARSNRLAAATLSPTQ